MNLKSPVEIAEFQKSGRTAKVMRDREEGYIVCKTDSKIFSGTRTAQYSTKEKAIQAAKNFIKKPVIWTKGRMEECAVIPEYRLHN